MTRVWKCVPALLVTIGLFCVGAEAKEFKKAEKGVKSETTKVRMGWEPGWKENFRAQHPVGSKSGSKTYTPKCKGKKCGPEWRRS
ncbi:MAG: hypothetical protein QOF19_2022 [Alphaproteobacteria bacterium]|jgi:hypothetical protein|nr:hypothetical protein [Alphaproteobacteria bacterium]MEA2976502.1 hypothetical protein [Alphaproteobacteria bacterium]